MKIILLIETFISLIHVFVDANPPATPKYPFLLNVDVNSPGLFELPSTVIPLVDDLHTGNVPKTAVAACPANAAKKALLLKLRKKLPYCIFQKTFQPDQTKTCEEEVKPLLRVQYTEINHLPRSCGTDPKHHHVYEYGFYYCGTTDVLDQLLDKNNKKNPDDFVKPRFYSIYEMCADSPHRRALWTKHSIKTPGIFQNDNPAEKAKLQKELGNDDQEIGIGDLPSRMKSKEFQGRANKFASQNKKKPDLVTLPTFMVPMEHVALRMWRKAVNHHINVAPFKKNKIRLMIGINNGIKKIALRLHSKKRRLSIYTAVRKFDHKRGKRGANWKTIQEPLVWYKLLYEEVDHLAAMVVLHSHDQPPPPGLSACKTRTICESMKHWYEKQSEDDVDGISEDLLSFAYCCITDTKEVDEIFHFHREIIGGLELDTHFNEANLVDDAMSLSPSAPPVSKNLGDEMYTRV